MLKRRPLFRGWVGINMEPREFCKRWFEATAEEEKQRGYRAKCVKLLSQVLGLEVNTVERWGSGIDFERIPDQYKITLGYANTIREMIESASNQGNLLDLVLQRLQGRDS